MRIAICEDEREQAAHVRELVEAWGETTDTAVELRVFHSAEAFLFTWPDVPFDLAILDIQMKEMTGVQLAEKIRETDSAMSIVFLTGVAQFVLRGYDVGALHYLIKPVNPPRLTSVLEKAKKLWAIRQRDTIVASNGAADCPVSLASISFISMTSHNAELHTNSGIFTLRKPAAQLEHELPSFFTRCHRSVIVNMHRVEYILYDSLGVLGGEVLPVSRNRRKAVNEAFLRIHKEL